jgi:protein TonB
MLRPALKNLETVDFTVYEQPKVAPLGITPITITKPVAPRTESKPRERTVFGLSKNSLDSSAITIKSGNTLAVAPDNKVMQPGDAQSLPIPSDEYLVTRMPEILTEVRIPYPQEAKVKAIEGAVVMDLLIDAEGNVRESRLLEGPGVGLNEAAMEAVKRFKFKPARIEQRAVAVRIRYVYRFVLEQ